jgi:MFS transporter, DHA1 family, tetracycline resistance protein
LTATDVKRKPSILIIFLTVFLDLVGFGIVLPLLPIYSQNLGASGLMIGIIMAAFSAMQFVFAPWWGRLSDRVGRRPVLLFSIACSALSYALFAVASGMTGEMALWVILISRIAAGICGANVSVAQAYIADITPPEDRSRRMGLIGMAFGLGFIFGPALGGLSLTWFGITGPGWVAAALCALTFVLALFILPESWRPDGAHAPQRPRLQLWAHTLSQPKVSLLIWLFFLATFAFTCFETTLGLLVAVNFNLDPGKPEDAKLIGYLFAYCGVIGAFVQGGAVGRAVKKLGEARLIAWSMFLTALSLGFLPFVSRWPALLAALALLAIGSSLARPPIFGLLSILTPANAQGSTMGVAQSFGSLARIVGPIFAAWLFVVNPKIPYLSCAAVSLVAGLVAWQWLIKDHPIRQANDEREVASESNGLGTTETHADP